MTSVIRVGLDFTIGHGGTYEPTVINPGTNLNKTVFVNGFWVGVVGDSYATHCRGGKHCHINPIASTGSTTVFIGGLPVHRAGDLLSCGDIAGINPALPPNVFIGM